MRKKIAISCKSHRMDRVGFHRGKYGRTSARMVRRLYSRFLRRADWDDTFPIYSTGYTD